MHAEATAPHCQLQRPADQTSYNIVRSWQRRVKGGTMPASLKVVNGWFVLLLLSPAG